MIKPYFENENGRLYCGDCLEILPQLEPVDLVLTDPPYGINESNEKSLSRGKIAKPIDYGYSNWDKKKVSRDHILKTVSAGQNCILFGGNYYADLLYPSPCWVVWDKDNGGNDFADCELAWTNFKSAVRKFKYRWNGMLKEAPEIRYHLTQKPVGLFIQILKKYAKPNHTILDCFAGSGTTALACERLPEMKLKWTLIEKEERYCEIAAKRIQHETQQLKLF